MARNTGQAFDILKDWRGDISEWDYWHYLFFDVSLTSLIEMFETNPVGTARSVHSHRFDHHVQVRHLNLCGKA